MPYFIDSTPYSYPSFLTLRPATIHLPAARPSPVCANPLYIKIFYDNVCTSLYAGLNTMDQCIEDI